MPCSSLVYFLLTDIIDKSHWKHEVPYCSCTSEALTPSRLKPSRMLFSLRSAPRYDDSCKQHAQSTLLAQRSMQHTLTDFWKRSLRR